jgi:hypothetical protein
MARVENGHHGIPCEPEGRLPWSRKTAEGEFAISARVAAGSFAPGRSSKNWGAPAPRREPQRGLSPIRPIANSLRSSKPQAPVDRSGGATGIHNSRAHSFEQLEVPVRVATNIKTRPATTSQIEYGFSQLTEPR